MYIAITEVQNPYDFMISTEVVGVFSEEIYAWAHPDTTTVYRCEVDEPHTLVEIIDGE